MIYHEVDIQLNVDNVARSHGDSAYLWLSSLVERLALTERVELAGLPAKSRIRPRSHKQGEPGQLYGLVEAIRWDNGTQAHRNLSDAGLAWLRSELADMPSKVTVEIGRIIEDGYLDAGILKASAWRPLGAPSDWLVLQAKVPADSFTDPTSGAALQRRWLGALRAAVDQLNPGFGHIEYGREEGRTALERYAAPTSPIDQRYPSESIECVRQRLRGYSWLTIASREVAAKLGGAETVSATGAFAEVETLACGGLWLLATEDFNDWGMPAAEAVFTALAPVLPPGVPVDRGWRNEPPTYLVFADPATR